MQGLYQDHGLGFKLRQGGTGSLRLKTSTGSQRAYALRDAQQGKGDLIRVYPKIGGTLSKGVDKRDLAAWILYLVEARAIGMPEQALVLCRHCHPPSNNKKQ